MTKHPYQHLESTRAWQVIDAELTSLVENGDIKETTARQYIVGSLCNALALAGVLNQAEASSAALPERKTL